MPELTYTEILVTTTCWCGIHLAIPANLHRIAHDEGKSVYCPLGHTFVYGKSYKEQLTEEKRRAKAARELLAAEERSHAATRGHLTRTKKRVGKGVCPCCKRHFEKLERHMASKHPEYAEAKS